MNPILPAAESKSQNLQPARANLSRRALFGLLAGAAAAPLIRESVRESPFVLTKFNGPPRLLVQRYTGLVVQRYTQMPLLSLRIPQDDLT
jgi:hypothetical protein